MLKVRLRPEAKKPPKGAMREAKVAIIMMWNCIGAMRRVVERKGRLWVTGMKTGLGVQVRPVKMLAPRSLTGQMK